jgi:hypothetical protein
MSTRRILPCCIAAVLALPAAVFAQPIGPPIDPNQVFQSQPRPQTTLPSPQVTAPGAPRPPTVSRPIPQGSVGQDRAAHCHHMAGVERVRKRDRGAYIHNCLQGN